MNNKPMFAPNDNVSKRNYYMRNSTFNPLAAGSIPARPTRISNGYGLMSVTFCHLMGRL